MTSYTPRLLSNHRLCSYSRMYAQIVEQTILSQITERTTPAQFAAAQQSLLALCQRLEAKVDLFHYPAETGTHQCVRDVYTDAVFRLKNISLMQPEPQPEPQAPKQQLLTVEGVVIDLEETIRTSREETYLGTDDDSADSGNTR
jgi:hypothetical protein